MDKLGLSELLFYVENLYYNSFSYYDRFLAIKYIKSYISFYYKNDIDLFLEDLTVGDLGFIEPEFISQIKNEIIECDYFDINELYEELIE